jgi:hypothetical protein
LYYQEHKEYRNCVEDMPVEENNSGKESRLHYLEVKVSEGSTGALG